MEFFATCPKGFEGLLADELRAIGVHGARPLTGQVAFASGTLEAAYRACLWSRLASRVFLVLRRGGAASSDELYDTVASVPWEEHLLRGATLSVDAQGTNAGLRDTRYTALRVKDAISDRALDRTGVRPRSDTRDPDLVVSCRLSRERATIALDLAGEPLFRRGYASAAQARSAAPALRPDYAAAALALAGWHRLCRHGGPCLVTLYSGAGTLPVEAAEQALDRAPGLLRARWGFEGWAGHDRGLWDEVMGEAEELSRQASGRALTLLACDDRHGTESSLRQTLRSAGLRVNPRFVSPGRLAPSLDSPDGPRLFACDLSWLAPDDITGEARALTSLRALAPSIRATDSLVTLSRARSLEPALGLAQDRRLGVILGQDEASLTTYDTSETRPVGTEVTLKDGTRVPVLVPESEQFARRLEKMRRIRTRWAKRELVSCYRVYDSDLPDYAVSIDLYNQEGGPGRWLSVSEYAAPRDIDPDLAHARLTDALTIAPLVLGVSPSCVTLRVRSHGRGGSQYASEGRLPPAGRRAADDLSLPPGAHLIEEGGLTFEVNFSGRLDCGIFLDHRETRSMIREMAKDMRGSRRFLNLFAYTGTATCYAADGGALHTTTVDLSRPSLEWARRNMLRNGFSGPGHEYVQADVLDWTWEQRHSPNRWDLIFCDAPTFSNSSRMRRGSWDVQRDHVELLVTLSRLLIRGGVCVFSCNLRGFRPDVEALARAGVEMEDITAQTIPEDFSRNPKVHHCYLVRRA